MIVRPDHLVIDPWSLVITFLSVVSVFSVAKNRLPDDQNSGRADCADDAASTVTADSSAAQPRINAIQHKVT